MPNGIVLTAAAVALGAAFVAVLRLRVALDTVELTLRITVSGLRAAVRAAARVPVTAGGIGEDVRRGQEALGRLDALKGQPVPPGQSQ